MLRLVQPQVLGIAFALIAVAPSLASPPSGQECADPPGYEALLAMPGVPVVLDSVEDPAEGPVVFDILAPPQAGLVPADACSAKIQPGSRMTSPAGCTMNWVFRDNDGALYIGSAGHCTSSVGQSVSVAGVGVIGTVAYRINAGLGNDFALVRIDPALYDLVDPSMCFWGGPIGAGFATLGEEVLVYGYGNIYGSAAVTRARVGEAQTTTTTVFTYIGFAQPGDSGMAIMSESGEAVALHTTSSLSVGSIRIDPSQKFGTVISHATALASAALGKTVTVEPSTVPVNYPPVP